MVVRFYSSVAPPTTLSAGITAGSATIQVGSTSGFPALTPYTLSVDYGSIGEELVQVNSVGGTTLTVDRGVDGTSATSHNAGAVIRHVTSARDHQESRDHENSDAGIHGLGPTEELVGTEKVQTLSNKTLDLAEGTLNRIDIFNGPSWVTTINGDVASPTVNVLQLKPNPSADALWSFNARGIQINRNSVLNDSQPNDYKFRITRSDGATDIVYMLAGGSIKTSLQNGNDGVIVQGSPDSVRRRAFHVLDNDGTTARGVLYTDGTMFLNSEAAALVTADIQMAPAQSVSALRVRTSALATVFSVSPAGAVAGTSVAATGAVTGATGTFTGAVTGSSVVDSSNGFSMLPARRGSTNVSFTSLTSFTVAVTYGATFPATPTVTTNINSGDGSTSRWSSRAINVSTTGFTLFVYSEGGGPAVTWSNIAVQWIAMGS